MARLVLAAAMLAAAAGGHTSSLRGVKPGGPTSEPLLNATTPAVLRMPDGSPRRIAWIHIMKCGGQFINTIFTWACPRAAVFAGNSSFGSAVVDNYPPSEWCDVEFKPASWHHVPYSPGLNGTGIGMFRDPASRMVSSFWHYLRNPKFLYHAPGHVMDEAVPIVAFANHSINAGCQTRMIMGVRCVHEFSTGILKRHVEEAKRRVREDFLFVGLTEAWEPTVELFHKMLGGPTWAAEFGTLRMNSAHDHDDQIQKENALNAAGVGDWADEELHAEVRRIFVERCERYGVSLEGRLPEPSYVRRERERGAMRGV